jgi:hypothetical protein
LKINREDYQLDGNGESTISVVRTMSTTTPAQQPGIDHLLPLPKLIDLLNEIKPKWKDEHYIPELSPKNVAPHPLRALPAQQLVPHLPPMPQK